MPTLTQQRLWTLQQLDPGSSAALGAAFLVTGDPEAGRLENAFKVALARHTALCRVLATRDDGYRMAMNYEKVESRSPQMKAMGVSDLVIGLTIVAAVLVSLAVARMIT